MRKPFHRILGEERGHSGDNRENLQTITDSRYHSVRLGTSYAFALAYGRDLCESHIGPKSHSGYLTAVNNNNNFYVSSRNRQELSSQWRSHAQLATFVSTRLRHDAHIVATWIAFKKLIRAIAIRIRF